MEKIMFLFKEACKKFDFLAAIGLFGVCLVVVLNILLRTLFNSPIYGAYEYVCYFTVLVISLALTNCAIQGGHINITFLTEKFSQKAQKVIEIITGFIIFVNFLLIMYNLIQYTQKTYLIGNISSNLHIPMYYVVGIIVVGFFLLTMFILLKLIEAIKKPS